MVFNVKCGTNLARVLAPAFFALVFVEVVFLEVTYSTTSYSKQGLKHVPQTIRELLLTDKALVV